MATQYIRIQVVSAGPDSSAVGASAYLTRELRIDDQTGKVFDFRANELDVLGKGIELPDDAPTWALEANGTTLWNAAQQAELLKDGSRYRDRAQLAYSVVLAMPKELEVEQNRELLEEWVRSEYTSRGLAVEWAIHRPDPDSPENVHAHLLVSTRRLADDGFGAKARGVMGSVFASGQRVAGDDVGKRWRTFQESFFAAKGIDLTVDPLSAVPRLRAPREVYEGRPVSGYARQVAEENRLRANESRELLRDPENLLELVTETHSVFTARDLDTALRKAGLDSEEAAVIREAALERSVALEDAEGERGYYTTAEVLADEAAAVHLAVGIAERGASNVPRRGHISQAVRRAGLDDEQRAAVESAALEGASNGLTIWRGVAGAGKSRAAGAARDAYEAAGWRVIGAAPTNTVARDLEGAGFRDPRTIASLLWRLDNGRERFDDQTVVMVDEAAMVATSDYLRLLAHVWTQGGRLLLVGDDRQLGSVARGGLFRVLVDTLGCDELATVRRQRDAAGREATRLLAAGSFRDALDIYDGLGAIQFSETGAEAAGALVSEWGRAARQNPYGARFVYARTNAEVDALSIELAAEARRIGVAGGRSLTYAAARGEVSLACGDRIQFRSNDRKLELFNGYCGTVIALARGRIVVWLDSGREIAFDPRTYTDFQLGYAGTVYRGQGKTQATVFALHGSFSDAASAYVALTRHTHDLRIHAGRDATPDLDAMAHQMGRAPKPGAALLYRLAGGSRSLLDQTLGLPELVREPEPAPAAAPADPTEERLGESWRELESALAALRTLEKAESDHRIDLTRQFLTTVERGATEDGRRLMEVYGRDDQELREAVERAISGDAVDPDDPVPGYSPRLLGRSAYRGLKKAIDTSWQLWRTTVRRDIDRLVRDKFVARRNAASKRVAAARRQLIERVDALCRPEHQALVARLCSLVRAADPDPGLAQALTERAGRLQRPDPTGSRQGPGKGRGGGRDFSR